MAVRLEKETGDLVVEGFNKGIASSPHVGIGNMQCVNISTELGEVMCSYSRTQVNQVPISNGTFSGSTSSHVHYSQSGTKLLAGSFVNVTASTITGLSTGYYWVYYDSSDTTTIVLSTGYLLVTALTFGTTGSATFSTVDMGAPIQNQPCVENYYDSSGNSQTRYYVGDVNGRVWVYDTALYNSFFWSGQHMPWSLASNSSDVSSSYSTASGLALLDGVLLLFTNYTSSNVGTAAILYKQTNRLDASWASATQALNSYLYPHFAFVNHNNYCFYTDGEFIGKILPSSTSSSGNVNIWSYGVVVVSGGSTDTLNIKNSNGGYLIGGNFPVEHQTVFFYSQSGKAPSGYSDGHTYYVVNANKTNGTFQIESSIGGGALTGLSNTGTIYFNSFWPNPSLSNNPSSISFQAVSLSPLEVSQCLTELGSNLLIGCQSNNIYNWDEISFAAGGSLTVIQAPENNTSSFVQANNVAYAFIGNKGNIYVTNGSYVSTAITVPDYTAGVPGTPSSYIEPYFVWGGTAFMRGRIWFSLQDQTATKTGNDGGVWSFVPSFFDPMTGTDQGMGLRLENQNSYGTYNGMANIILPLVSQAGLGSQFYSVWTSDGFSGIVYGIDSSGTTPYTGGQTIIETDLIKSGTILGKQKVTFSNIEYKLSSPLASGESVALKYRLNLTDSWTTVGTPQNDSSGISGYWSPIPFENTQEIQFQIILTSTGTNPTFVRLLELRIR